MLISIECMLIYCCFCRTALGDISNVPSTHTVLGGKSASVVQKKEVRVVNSKSWDNSDIEYCFPDDGRRSLKNTITHVDVNLPDPSEMIFAKPVQKKGMSVSNKYLEKPASGNIKLQPKNQRSFMPPSTNMNDSKSAGPSQLFDLNQVLGIQRADFNLPSADELLRELEDI
jgi:hypothetical protein